MSAKNGNKKAFDKLYKLTSNDVWFTCVSLLKDEENAKDIMQETYITAFLKLDTLKDEEKFCGWLTTIATNKSKNKMEAVCLDYGNIGNCYQIRLLLLFLVRPYSDFPLKVGSRSLYQIGVDPPLRPNNLR